LITANQATAGPSGLGGSDGNAVAGQGGSPGGATAKALYPGSAGAAGISGQGQGGGLARNSGESIAIDDTAIAGNTASPSDGDVLTG
jgi:hypothetical protein